MQQKSSLIAFLCDPDGIVKRVLRDDFDFEMHLSPGQPWTLILDTASLDKALMFLQQVNELQLAVDWELIVRMAKEIIPLHFSGGRVEEHMLIVGATNSEAANRFYEDEILAINNEQANLIRSLIKEKNSLQPQKGSRDFKIDKASKLHEIILDDAAKLNNELVTLQRKLTKANRELEQKQHLLQSIMETMPDVLYTIDLSGMNMLFSNRRIETVLGYLPDDKTGSSSVFFEEYLHPEDLAKIPERLERCKQADDEDVIETEYRLKHVSGSWRWFRSRDTVFKKDGEGNPTQILGIAQDISVYKTLQEKLWSLSIHDALTGLYNRTYFENELDRLKNSRQLPVSVVMMDINNLKEVNDKEGHAVGDELLRRAADVFSKAFRAGDILARIGGDEFAVLLPQTDTDTVQVIEKRVSSLIDSHNQSRNHEIPLSLAIGCATAAKPEEFQETIKRADEKMYANKAGLKSKQIDKKHTPKEETDALNH